MVKWIRNSRGNAVLVEDGNAVGTVFFHCDRNGEGYKYVVDGNFSDFFDSEQDAKDAVFEYTGLDGEDGEDECGF